MDGSGVPVVDVSPPYVGLADSPDEVLPMERRAPIKWGVEHGMMVGHANPWAPKAFGFVLYFRAPFGPPCFAGQIDQPQTRPAEGYHAVGPILMTGNQITAEL